MSVTVSDIVKQFTFNKVNIDNWVFKLFYIGCFSLFLSGHLLSVMTQTLFKPIICDIDGISDKEYANTYCWIHGSSHIGSQYQERMKCIVDHDGIESADDAPDTSYYQWVTIVLLFQAGSFMLPYKIWRAMEGGLIEQFGLEAKSGIILKEENDRGESLESLVEKYVSYYKSTFHRNQWYFAKYIFCEMLNYVILMLNFYLTDWFLNGQFWNYGWRWIQYNQLSSRYVHF